MSDTRDLSNLTSNSDCSEAPDGSDTPDCLADTPDCRTHPWRRLLPLLGLLLLLAYSGAAAAMSVETPSQETPLQGIDCNSRSEWNPRDCDNDRPPPVVYCENGILVNCVDRPGGPRPDPTPDPTPEPTPEPTPDPPTEDPPPEDPPPDPPTEDPPPVTRTRVLGAGPRALPVPEDPLSPSGPPSARKSRPPEATRLVSLTQDNRCNPHPGAPVVVFCRGEFVEFYAVVSQHKGVHVMTTPSTATLRALGHADGVLGLATHPTSDERIVARWRAAESQIELSTWYEDQLPHQVNKPYIIRITVSHNVDIVAW